MTIKLHQTSLKSAEETLYKRYQVRSTLGRGRFAVVKSARHLITNERVAVKIIDKTKLDINSAERLYNEVEYLRLAKHASIVKLYEAIDTPENLYLILERADRGDLYDFIMEHSCIIDDETADDSDRSDSGPAGSAPAGKPGRVQAGIGESLARRFFRQIAQALWVCHHNNIVHRDLKPENVVIFSETSGQCSTQPGSTGSLAKAPQTVPGVLAAAAGIHINSDRNLSAGSCGSGPFEGSNAQSVGATIPVAPVVQLRAKITDFGFSNKFNPENQLLATSCGSLAYSAPEILLGDEYIAPAVDIWSLGVLLYMLVCGSAPFNEANDSETLTCIMDCKFEIPKYVSRACQHLIRNMITLDPRQRLTIEQVLKHPWVQKDASYDDDHLRFITDSGEIIEDSMLVSNSWQPPMEHEICEVWERVKKSGIDCAFDQVKSKLLATELDEFSATCDLQLVSVRRNNRRKLIQMSRPQSADMFSRKSGNSAFSLHRPQNHGQFFPPQQSANLATIDQVIPNSEIPERLDPPMAGTSPLMEMVTDELDEEDLTAVPEAITSDQILFTAGSEHALMLATGTHLSDLAYDDCLEAIEERVHSTCGRVFSSSSHPGMGSCNLQSPHQGPHSVGQYGVSQSNPTSGHPHHTPTGPPYTNRSASYHNINNHIQFSASSNKISRTSSSSSVSSNFSIQSQHSDAHKLSSSQLNRSNPNCSEAFQQTLLPASALLNTKLHNIATSSESVQNLPSAASTHNNSVSNILDLEGTPAPLNVLHDSSMSTCSAAASVSKQGRSSGLRTSTQSAAKRRLSGTTAVPQRESMTITPRKTVSENVKSILQKTTSSSSVSRDIQAFQSSIRESVHDSLNILGADTSHSLGLTPQDYSASSASTPKNYSPVPPFTNSSMGHGSMPPPAYIPVIAAHSRNSSISSVSSIDNTSNVYYQMNRPLSPMELQARGSKHNRVLGRSSQVEGTALHQITENTRVTSDDGQDGSDRDKISELIEENAVNIPAPPPIRNYRRITNPAFRHLHIISSSENSDGSDTDSRRTSSTNLASMYNKLRKSATKHKVSKQSVAAQHSSIDGDADQSISGSRAPIASEISSPGSLTTSQTPANSLGDIRENAIRDHTVASISDRLLDGVKEVIGEMASGAVDDDDAGALVKVRETSKTLPKEGSRSLSTSDLNSVRKLKYQYPTQSSSTRNQARSAHSSFLRKSQSTGNNQNYGPAQISPSESCMVGSGLSGNTHNNLKHVRSLSMSLLSRSETVDETGEYGRSRSPKSAFHPPTMHYNSPENRNTLYDPVQNSPNDQFDHFLLSILNSRASLKEKNPIDSPRASQGPPSSAHNVHNRSTIIPSNSLHSLPEHETTNSTRAKSDLGASTPPRHNSHTGINPPTSARSSVLDTTPGSPSRMSPCRHSTSHSEDGKKRLTASMSNDNVSEDADIITRQSRDRSRRPQYYSSSNVAAMAATIGGTAFASRQRQHVRSSHSLSTSLDKINQNVPVKRFPHSVTELHKMDQKQAANRVILPKISDNLVSSEVLLGVTEGAGDGSSRITRSTSERAIASIT